MASHPYISGAGNVTQMIGFLRKSFPPTVNSDTVKKLGVAPKNESYVINALQFIGVIDKEGKRTDRGREVLTMHDEEAFKEAFEGLIRDSYKDLFDLRGDDAWTMNKDALIGYFRSADRTSEVIGTRQAALFQAFGALAGHEQTTATPKNGIGPRIPPESGEGHPFDERNIHPDIANVSLKLFDDGHHAQATFEAFKLLDNKVRDVSGIQDSGCKLMMAAFNEANPKIKLNDLLTTSDKDEQMGFRYVFAGSMSAIRNPRGHDIRTDPIDLCLDHLSFALVLLRTFENRKSPC